MQEFHALYFEFQVLEILVAFVVLMPGLQYLVINVLLSVISGVFFINNLKYFDNSPLSNQVPLQAEHLSTIIPLK